MSNIIPNEEIRAKMRMRREDLHLTQQELADVLGRDMKSVRNWEASKEFVFTSMKLSNYIALCEALQCDLSYLLTDQATPFKETAELSSQTTLSIQAVDHLLEMSSRNQWFALRALDALLRYDSGSILEQIGYYLSISPEMQLDLPDGYQLPVSSMRLNLAFEQLTLLRQRVQSGNLQWPENSSPHADSDYVWL